MEMSVESLAFVDILNMIDELDKNKLTSSAVQRLDIEKNELLEQELLEDNLCIVMSGVIQTESDKGNIMSFSQAGDILYVDPIKNEKGEIWMPLYRTVMPCELVQIDKEYFLNFSAMKPSFMELLLNMMTKKMMHVYNDGRKYNLTVEGRFDFSLLELGKELGQKDKHGKYVLPRFINKSRIASFSKTTKKYTANRLNYLEEQGSVAMKKDEISVQL